MIERLFPGNSGHLAIFLKDVQGRRLNLWIVPILGN